MGLERIKGAYAWRSLRRDKSLEPADGWYADEAVTIDEAVRAYTTWSAYAGYREDKTGVIAEGRWADLTVMNIDPFVSDLRRPRPCARKANGAFLSGPVRLPRNDRFL